MNRILLTFFGFWMTFLAGAQTLTIESFKPLEGDISARMNRRDDLNGKPSDSLKTWTMVDIVEVAHNSTQSIGNRVVTSKLIPSFCINRQKSLTLRHIFTDKLDYNTNGFKKNHICVPIVDSFPGEGAGVSCGVV